MKIFHFSTKNLAKKTYPKISFFPKNKKKTFKAISLKFPALIKELRAARKHVDGEKVESGGRATATAIH